MPPIPSLDKKASIGKHQDPPPCTCYYTVTVKLVNQHNKTTTKHWSASANQNLFQLSSDYEFLVLELEQVSKVKPTFKYPDYSTYILYIAW